MNLGDNGHDVIVVGSGATGGWAAKVLTERGLNVLLLEAGSRLDVREGLRLPGSTMPGDDPQSATAPKPKDDRAGAGNGSERQQVQSQCYAFDEGTKHMFVDDLDHPYETPADKPFTWIRMRLVGGRTALWNRVALRMSDRQFKAASIDGFGLDWPIGYSDLEAHYAAIERFVGVYGLSDGLPEVPDGCFIPAALSKAALEFKRSVEMRWPERRVTALRQTRFLRRSLRDHEASPPEQADFNDIQPFYCSAASSIAAADLTGRLSLQCDAIVSRVVINSRGTRAEGVEYVDRRSMRTHEAHAKAIVLCASTIESTRILLNSVSRHHPHGIGNSNGMLGRHLSDHTFGVGVIGRRKGECTASSNIYIPNFRNVAGDKQNFLRGYAMQGRIGPAAGGSTQCDMWCFGEMLPRETNRVTLSSSPKDKWGIAVPQISCTYSENELEMVADQTEQISRIAEAAGYDIVWRGALAKPGTSMHELGTARMGADPRSSVLNSYNQCWELSNLLVTDGAAFASTGFQNPTLTMMAITSRACHHLADQFRRGEFAT